MIKSRTVQLIYLTAACTVGLFGTAASVGLFVYDFIWDFYIQFTNISNYFCVGILFAELIQTVRRKDDGFVSACPTLKFMGMLAILLTFLVFNIMLAPAREPHLNYTVNSLAFHVLIPILYIADWFLFYERKKVKWTFPLYSVGFPLIYAILVFVHAALLGFDSSITAYGGTNPLIYPYFFLNLDNLGVGGVAKWIVILLIAFVAVGFAFYGIDRLSRKKKD